MAVRGRYQKGLSRGNQELTLIHLFALLEREQLIKQVRDELGLLGTLCQPTQLKNLLTFSAQGRYEAVL
jgi:hypothetical protein